MLGWRWFQKSLTKQRGVCATEYALLCALIMPMLVLAIANSGESINSKLYFAGSGIQNISFGSVYMPGGGAGSGDNTTPVLNPITAGGSTGLGGGSQTTGGSDPGDEDGPQARGPGMPTPPPSPSPSPAPSSTPYF